MVGEFHRDVAGLLGYPVGDRLGGHACDSDETRVVVDEDEHVEPPEQHRVNMDEVAGDDALSLGVEERCPARS